jgi:hypothetical protein
MDMPAILKYGHATLIQSVANLPDDAWEVGGVCGAWSVRDIFAHLASYEKVLVDVLEAQLGDHATPRLHEFVTLGDSFNDILVARYAGKSPADVLLEYTSAHIEVARLAAQIPPERSRLNGTIGWYGDEYALDDFIVYSFYGHKREHAAQIDKFRDTLTGAP